MTKKEIAKLIDTMKHRKTDGLKFDIDQLSTLEDKRDLTKRMYFWSNFGNASQREYFTKRYSADETIVLTNSVKVRYIREVDPSRSHAYASDRLFLMDGNDEKKFTIADAKKIVAALQEIVDRRN